MAAILMAARWGGGGEKVEETELGGGGGSERAIKAPQARRQTDTTWGVRRPDVRRRAREDLLLCEINNPNAVMGRKVLLSTNQRGGDGSEGDTTVEKGGSDVIRAEGNMDDSAALLPSFLLSLLEPTEQTAPPASGMNPSLLGGFRFELLSPAHED